MHESRDAPNVSEAPHLLGLYMLQPKTISCSLFIEDGHVTIIHNIVSDGCTVVTNSQSVRCLGHSRSRVTVKFLERSTVMNCFTSSSMLKVQNMASDFDGFKGTVS